MGRNGSRMFCRSEWKQGRLGRHVIANRVVAITIMLGFAAGMPTAAPAWGAEGHRLVAGVAEGQLGTTPVRGEHRMLGRVHLFAREARQQLSPLSGTGRKAPSCNRRCGGTCSLASQQSVRLWQVDRSARRRGMKTSRLRSSVSFFAQRNRRSAARIGSLRPVH